MSRSRFSSAGSRIVYFTRQRFVDLPFGKRGIGPKHHLLLQFPSVPDLLQKHFLSRFFLDLFKT